MGVLSHKEMGTAVLNSKRLLTFFLVGCLVLFLGRDGHIQDCDLKKKHTKKYIDDWRKDRSRWSAKKRKDKKCL